MYFFGKNFVAEEKRGESTEGKGCSPLLPCNSALSAVKLFTLFFNDFMFPPRKKYIDIIPFMYAPEISHIPRSHAMKNIYVYYIIGIMLILPVVSIALELSLSKRDFNSKEKILCGIKWFIFWGMGMRCFTAGVSQSMNPKFTASILQVSEESFVVIKELGFANICLSIVALGSLLLPQWRKAAACSAGLYLGVAGLFHVTRIPLGINFKETVAMVSDLFILLIVIFYLIYSWRSEKEVLKKV